MLHIPPDPVKVVIDYLAQQPDVTALCENVSGNYPTSPPTTHLQVVRIDGDYRDRAAWSETSLLDIHARATVDDTANLLARTARAALMRIVGYAHRDGVITDVNDAGGPHDLADDGAEPPTPRYIFSISITAHP